MKNNYYTLSFLVSLSLIAFILMSFYSNVQATLYEINKGNVPFGKGDTIPGYNNNGHNFVREVLQRIEAMEELCTKNEKLINFYENKYQCFQIDSKQISSRTDYCRHIDRLSIENLFQIEDCLDNVLSIQESIINKYEMLINKHYKKQGNNK